MFLALAQTSGDKPNFIIISYVNKCSVLNFVILIINFHRFVKLKSFIAQRDLKAELRAGASQPADMKVDIRVGQCVASVSACR